MSKRTGKTRIKYIIDSAHLVAEDRLLDQIFVKVDAESHQHYLDILDRPPHGEGFDKLMAAPKPWRD